MMFCFELTSMICRLIGTCYVALIWWWFLLCRPTVLLTRDSMKTHILHLIFVWDLHFDKLHGRLFNTLDFTQTKFHFQTYFVLKNIYSQFKIKSLQGFRGNTIMGCGFSGLSLQNFSDTLWFFMLQSQKAIALLYIFSLQQEVIINLH